MRVSAMAAVHRVAVQTLNTHAMDRASVDNNDSRVCQTPPGDPPSVPGQESSPTGSVQNTKNKQHRRMQCFTQSSINCADHPRSS